jgi:hypothetical protein
MKFKSLFEFCAAFIMLTAGIGDYIYCIFNKTIPGVIWKGY